MSKHGTVLPLVVLISGNGSNLQAIIDSIRNEDIPAQIKLVISNRPQAYGLERARRANINTVVLDHTEFATRQSFDAALAKLIDQFGEPLVIMAGFMRILSDKFVNRFHGRLINIHPSLLPKYRGLNTHQRVLQAGETRHGATVHFVVPELDSGPVILQGQIDVLPDDTEERLAQRVHEMEHRIYPQVVRWFAANRLRLETNTVLLDGHPITAEERLYS
jgi:phosphoribosylglycinamide formyltransferase-1